jgi:hypothetical protein
LNTVATYRGKYPNRINSVSGTRERGVVLVVLNSGRKYHVHASSTGGEMPKLGTDISEYPGAVDLTPVEVPMNKGADGNRNAPCPFCDTSSHIRFNRDGHGIQESVCVHYRGYTIDRDIGTLAVFSRGPSPEQERADFVHALEQEG